jgi:flagellar protein FliO/FliZ
MTFETLIAAIGSLVLVLGLVLMAQRAARWGGLVPRGGGRLALVEAVALDPRRRLSLVRCDGRHVLVLTGGAQDVVVGWVEPPPEAERAP